MSTTGSPKLRADARANRDAIVRSAAELYGERGLDVPFDDIAAHAGVGRATLYRHFPEREDLLNAILGSCTERVERVAETIDAGPDRFFELFRAALRVNIENLPLTQLIPARERVPEVVDALRARHYAVFEQPLADAQAAGLVRADLTPQDVHTLLKMLTSVIRPGTPRPDKERAWNLAFVTLGADPRPL